MTGMGYRQTNSDFSRGLRTMVKASGSERWMSVAEFQRLS